MTFQRKDNVKRQFRVEIYKGVKVYENENYDFIQSREFFLLEADALKYIEKLNLILETDWIIRYFKKIEAEWILFQEIGINETKTF